MATNDHGITKLTDYEHARQRTEMYLGSRSLHTAETIVYDDTGAPSVKELTWVPAVYTAFREAIDNALDEVIGHGSGDTVKIEYDDRNCSLVIEDNGRGIPIDYSDEHGQYLATMVLTETKAGRNFNERGEVAGTNGLGISIVNFCSRKFTVTIQRNNKQFTQTFMESPGNEQMAEMPKIKTRNSTSSGTKIELQLSEKVFSDRSLPLEFVHARVHEIALCNPTVKIFWNGGRIKVKPTPEKTLFPKVTDRPIIVEIKEEGFRSRFFLKPGFTDNSEVQHSIVNNIPAFNGGVHMENFRKFFYAGILEALTPQSKKRKLQPNRSDLNDGMLIYNITNMIAPDFDSQSKTRLINETVAKHIKTAMEDPKLFKNIISRNPGWIEHIYERCAARTQKKDAKDVAKLARKNLRGKVPDLLDAVGKDRSKCILLIGEGDCIEENTNIKAIIDGKLRDIKIKDAEIGQLVLTHTNSFKAIVDKNTKVKSGKKIKTKYGEMISSNEHKWLVYNIETDVYDYVQTIDIDISKHKLVKSKVIDFDILNEVIEIASSNKDGFDLLIKQKTKNGIIETHTSNEHRFAVFDVNMMQFVMKKAKDIKIGIDTTVGLYQ